MAAGKGGDGLLRWLLGGLAVGGVALGVAAGIYESVRGDGGTPVVVVTTPPATTTQGPAGTGERLFTAYACGGCHSLDGSAGVGPTIKGLAGSRVELADGTTTAADDAYLAESLTDSDAQIVKGYSAGVMSAAVKGFGLVDRPADVEALVAFMEAKK